MSFGWIARKWLMPFGQIVCKWLFCLCGIAWKNMMEMGRGGACVPARVALQGRIHHPFPAHNACVFGMETPLRGRSGGHTGAAPTIPNTHRRSAKVKTKILMLAVMLQTMKCKNIVLALRGDDKTRKYCSRAAR